MEVCTTLSRHKSILTVPIDVFDPSFLALDWENLASLCSFLDPSTDASYSYDGGKPPNPMDIDTSTHRGSFVARLSSVEGDDTSTSSHEWSTTALSRPELINQPYGSQGNSLAQKNYPGPAVIPICDFSRCPSSNPSPLRDSIQIPTQEEHFEHNYGAYATQNGLSIEESFPLPTQNHLDLRRALEAVLASPWKIQNAFEPRHDVLTAFLHSDADRKRWSCSFWAGGTPCTCSFSKKDQAKNHVRFHINHLPFSCRSKGTW